jgi:hypothetical protein
MKAIATLRVSIDGDVKASRAVSNSRACFKTNALSIDTSYASEFETPAEAGSSSSGSPGNWEMASFGKTGQYLS